MEDQIREQFEKAFWDLLDNDPTQDHLRRLLEEEIVVTLCNFVPNRTDIHKQIKDDLISSNEPIDWGIQIKLLNWVEKFQAPIYDQVTEQWKRNCPEPVGQFLKKYYQHLQKVEQQIRDHRIKASSLLSNNK